MKIGDYIQHKFSPKNPRLLLAWGTNALFKTALVWNKIDGYRYVDLMHYIVFQNSSEESINLRNELMTVEKLSDPQHLKWIYGSQLSD